MRSKLHTKKDVRRLSQVTENGIIDQVLVTTNANGNKFVKVRVRNTRIPQTGDKLLRDTVRRVSMHACRRRY